MATQMNAISTWRIEIVPDRWTNNVAPPPPRPSSFSAVRPTIEFHDAVGLSELLLMYRVVGHLP